MLIIPSSKVTWTSSFLTAGSSARMTYSLSVSLMSALGDHSTLRSFSEPSASRGQRAKLPLNMRLNIVSISVNGSQRIKLIQTPLDRSRRLRWTIEQALPTSIQPLQHGGNVVTDPADLRLHLGNEAARLENQQVAGQIVEHALGGVTDEEPLETGARQGAHHHDGAMGRACDLVDREDRFA